MKRVVLFLALISLSSAVYAQDYSNRGEGNKVIRGPYETNRLWDNWVIGVGTGINIYQGNSDSHQRLGQRISMAIDLSASKWITPGIGFRIQYSGLNAKGSTNFESSYATSSLGDGFYKEKFNVSNLHSEVLWNFSNLISGYREDRMWDVIPYVGVGWVRSWNKTGNANEYATSIGVLNTVRLNDLLNLTVEARQMITSNRLDRVNCGSKYDGMTSITVGVSIKLGKRDFKRVVVPNYSPYNKRISALQAQNRQLELKVGENREKVIEHNPISTTPVALFFKIGKVTLNSKELVNLDFYVKNAITVDKDKVFTIIGTADSATGSTEGNQRLSENRMQYVYNILIDKYGISPNRLIKKAEGDSNDRFETPELNRTVIIQ